MTSPLFALFFLFLFSVIAVDAFRLQGVGVKGTLLCQGAHSVHTSVAIFDVDRNPGDADDLLDKAFTDRKGRFVLDGATRELTRIEPELRILHDCADGIKVGGGVHHPPDRHGHGRHVHLNGEEDDRDGSDGRVIGAAQGVYWVEPCHRLLVIKVPPEFIHSGTVANFYDIGTIELADKRADEQRTCQQGF